MIKLIIGGILSIPGFLVHIVTAPIVAVLSAPAMLFLVFTKSSSQKAALSSDPKSKRVIVTGGSSGIGKSIAVAAAKLGISEIIILARNPERLEAARQEIQSAANDDGVVVKALSVNVGDPESLEKAARDEIFASNHKTTHLFCCAGAAYANYFEQVPSDVFARAVQTNQLGSIYTAQCLVPKLGQGSVTFCSSGAGQVGVFGFTSYCPTKFAVRGYAECLHAELVDRPIYVQVAYPPDTDTPGFAEENKTKPYETKKISENAGLFQPDQIGQGMLKAALQPNPPFNVYFGFEGWLMSTLTSGMQPVSTVVDAVAQVAFMSVIRWISLFVLNDWHNMIRDCAKKKKTAAAQKED